jgi:hypothetical protein
MRNPDLLLENRRRTANTAPLESNIYLYTIGDLDERDAACHAVVFAIKSYLHVPRPWLRFPGENGGSTESSPRKATESGRLKRGRPNPGNEVSLLQPL